MADLKISQLTAISVLTPATDVLPVVDVGGVTKKITTNQILGSGGTATLASATISGNLTVDTSTLFVNSSNHRVGIGTVTPLSNLHVGSGTGLNNLGVGLSRGATTNFYEAFDGTKSFLAGTDSSQAGVKVGSLTNHPLYLVSNNTSQLEITHPGIFVFNDGAGGTRMTLNSTGLGVGASPSYKIHVAGVPAATNGALAYLRDTTANGSNTSLGTILFSSSPGTDFYIGKKSLNTVGSFVIGNGNTGAEYVSVDASGNVGIGVTPAGTGGCLQLKSGITFPATQVASSDANTLDDYEEGTFTPTIVGTSTAGTGTYTTQAGRYTKIGNRVFCEMFIAWTAHTGTGNMDINTNLPFTSNSSVFYSAASIGDTSGITLTASNTLGAVIVANSTLIRFRQMPVGGGNSNPVPIDTAGDVTLSISYIV